MVAAEAAACGALPVVADHSGLGEVARTLREAVPEAARGWLSFAAGRHVGGGARGRALGLAGGAGGPAGAHARDDRAVTRERYSWDGVARTVIAAARGELDDLPTV